MASNGTAVLNLFIQPSEGKKQTVSKPRTSQVLLTISLHDVYILILSFSIL